MSSVSATTSSAVNKLKEAITPIIRKIVHEEIRRALLDESGVLGRVISEVLRGVVGSQVLVESSAPVAQYVKPAPSVQPASTPRPAKTTAQQDVARFRQRFEQQSGISRDGMIEEVKERLAKSGVPKGMFDFVSSAPVVSDVPEIIPGMPPQMIAEQQAQAFPTQRAPMSADEMAENPFARAGMDPNDAGVDLSVFGDMQAAIKMVNDKGIGGELYQRKVL